MSAQTVAIRVVGFDIDGQREVGDRLVPFLAIEPELGPADIALGIIRLELDDLAPIVDRAVKLISIRMNDGHQRI